MRLPRSVTMGLFAAALAATPLAAAQAQYAYYPCNPFPLTWPFCIAGAAVGTAAAIASAPFYAAGAAPYYYYGSPYYYAPGYYYAAPRRRWHRRYRHH